MKEKRLFDIWEQSKFFDKITPQVREVVTNVLEQKGITEFSLLTEKMGLRFSLYRWRIIWGLQNLEDRITGCQAEIYLRFPTITSEQITPFFAARVRRKWQNQWRERVVATENLSKESLTRLIDFALKNPSNFSQLKKRQQTNLGCPAGCAASRDRFQP